MMTSLFYFVKCYVFDTLIYNFFHLKNQSNQLNLSKCCNKTWLGEVGMWL